MTIETLECELPDEVVGVACLQMKNAVGESCVIALWPCLLYLCGLADCDAACDRSLGFHQSYRCRSKLIQYLSRIRRVKRCQFLHLG